MRGLLALLITASCVDAYATVNSEVSTQTYTCDGLTAAYIVPFSYQHPTDLTVTSTTSGGVSSTLTYGSSFTLSLSSTPTRATLTLTAPATSCPSGSKLLVSRKVPNTQPTSLGTQGRYYPQTVEGMFDWLEYQNQQTNVRIDNILSYDGGTSISLQDGGVSQGSITALNCTGDAVTCSTSAGVGRLNDTAPIITKSYSWAKEVFAPDAGNVDAVTAVGHGTGAGGRFTGGASAGDGIDVTAGAGGIAASITGNVTVEADDGNNAIDATSSTNGYAISAVASGTGIAGTFQSSTGSGALQASASGGNGYGLSASGHGSGNGVTATGGATGAGVVGNGGATSGDGVSGVGGTAINAVGTKGTSTASAQGIGVWGTGTFYGVYGAGSGTADGVHGVGAGTAWGIYGTGGSGTSNGGVLGLGAAGSADGVVGIGTGGSTTFTANGAGVLGVGGAGAGNIPGGKFTGGGATGDGVQGTGISTGSGGVFTSPSGTDVLANSWDARSATGMTIGVATATGVTITPATTVTSAKNKGTCTLGTNCGSITVTNGSICVCSDDSATAACKVSVTMTTLTITGTGTDVISYLCF